jgi:DNA-binding IclR family transcriptional regulator
MASNDPPEIKVKTTKTIFAIIEFLQEADGATLTEIAEETGLGKSTVHNHLSTLQYMGYVVAEDEQYYPGLRFLQIGTYLRTRKDEYDIIKSKVDDLAADTGERAQFIISENGLGTCLYTASGHNAVRTEPQVGSQLYLHSSAAGKAILSKLPDADVGAVIDRWGLPAVTDQTITDREALDAELAEIRERGYSFNREENLAGLRAVGVPLLDPNGSVIGALSIMGPTHRMNGDRFTEELPEVLLGTKNELELNIEHTA